ncbi:cysteine-rich receptor-like protein kinase 15 isoform X2 [Tanacetum coccineum]
MSAMIPVYYRESAYKQDLDNVFNSLITRNNGFGFYNSTSGQANAAAFCRGDLEPETCQKCVDKAGRDLRQRCPIQVEAGIWYEACSLRYSNQSMGYGIDDTFWYHSDPNNVSDSSYDIWKQTVTNLLGALQPEAAGGGKVRKYASRSITEPGLSTIYGYMQCSPDLLETECYQCLLKATADTLDDRSLGNGTGNRRAKVKERLPSSFLFCLGSSLLPKFQATLKNCSPKGNEHDSEVDDTREMNLFSFSIIQVATNNFSADNKLGEGGFGPVYKGVLQDGKAIAVKRLSSNSGQGPQEFKTEVQLIIKLQHKNLVRLLGYCIKGIERLLIYEFMANNSLETFLSDPNKCQELDWAKRANIVRGIAKGLRYLHEDSRLKIIHRDMKASNILLDAELNSKISDFGTARIFGVSETEANTNRIVGTYGYLAPEYAMEGLFSTKSDVYSFGILLLEIISGQLNYRFCIEDVPQNFLSAVWRLWRENKGEQLIDRSLNPDFPITEAMRWINIALLCVQEDPKSRPTMSTVVFMLEGQWSQNLPAPLEPRSSFTRYATVLELTMTTSDTTTNPSIDLTNSVIDPLPKKKKFFY